jgi:hypothetical protein
MKERPARRLVGGKPNKVVNAFKKLGKELKPVAKALTPIAKKFVKDVVVPTGKTALKSYLSGDTDASGATNLFTQGVASQGKQQLQNLGSPSGSGRRHRKGRKRPEMEYDSSCDEEDMEEGGALLSYHPREFHSHSYPKGLASYKATRPSKSGGSKPKSARGAIVSRVMKEKGMSLPEASKYVKEKGLY